MPSKKNVLTKAPVEKPENGKSLKPVFSRSTDYKSFYVNFVQAGYTGFDIYLNLGETSGASPNGELPIEMKARVSMTPVEAKLLSRIIESTIKKYEEQFGKVVVPAALQLEGV